MAKKNLTKAQLINEIETKIQALNLLQSAIQADRSRKPETLEEYQQKYQQLLEK